MIMQALYQYFQDHRDEFPLEGLAATDVWFLIVIDRDGNFVRIEDCRVKNGKKVTGTTFNLMVGPKRSANVLPYYLYDKISYVLGYRCPSDKTNVIERYDAFVKSVQEIASRHTESVELRALCAFYAQGQDNILKKIKEDSLWPEMEKELEKNASRMISFRLDGDKEIIAEKHELLDLGGSEEENGTDRCLITGKKCEPVRIFRPSPITGCKPAASIMTIQSGCGFESYGRKQCLNAPISKEAEHAISSAFIKLTRIGSPNRYDLGDRMYIFWTRSDVHELTYDQEKTALFGLLQSGGSQGKEQDPDERLQQMTDLFKSIVNGKIVTTNEDRFYMLCVTPNAARMYFSEWSDVSLREFAANIVAHQNDTRIYQAGSMKTPYIGLWQMMSTIQRDGKVSNLQSGLPSEVVESIFKGRPYPYALLNGVINRIRAELKLSDSDPRNYVRAAIIKAYLNRKYKNSIIKEMLDKENSNPAYLCGRLFSLCVRMQEVASSKNNARINQTIKSDFMNAASATPSLAFATVLKLSEHHASKLTEGQLIYYDKLKSEIMGMFNGGFPTRLNLEEQGMFFLGYYQQRQDFFTKKTKPEDGEENNADNE